MNPLSVKYWMPFSGFLKKSSMDRDDLVSGEMCINLTTVEKNLLMFLNSKKKTYRQLLEIGRAVIIFIMMF